MADWGLSGKGAEQSSAGKFGGLIDILIILIVVIISLVHTYIKTLIIKIYICAVYYMSVIPQ